MLDEWLRTEVVDVSAPGSLACVSIQSSQGLFF